MGVDNTREQSTEQGARFLKFLNIVSVVCSILIADIASADRCPNGIVALGDSKFEVIAKCGEPTFEDFRQFEKVAQTGIGEVTRWIVDIEELIYDFGPNRFIRVFVFENDILAKISQGGYGKSTEADGKNYLRKNQKVQKGDTKYEVMIKLGYPVNKEKREIEKARRVADGETDIHHIFYEEWTFDPGPGRLIRMVVFENGRVTRMETGDRSKQ